VGPIGFHLGAGAIGNFDLSVLFFLQLALILGACKLVGRIAKAIGQPEVVGQMIAGVLLGPSLLGAVWPEWFAWLFPPQSRSVIYVLAQLGLSLYMFLVGLEFRTDLLAKRARSAAAVSLSGIFAPFVLGGLVAWWAFDRYELFPEGVQRHEAMLFMGSALAITAFPMLARIITERGLAGTSMGTLLLAAGAIDDVVAWGVLALILAMLADNWWIAAKAIGGAVAYAFFARLVLKPLLAKWLNGPTLGSKSGLAAGVAPSAGKSAGAAQDGGAWPLAPEKFVGVLMLLALASWFTDIIGVYAVFGAFMLGLVMPRGTVATSITRMAMPLASTMLLPMFFVSSGLSTRLTLLDSWALWALAGVVTLAACGGKLLACALAARLAGEPTRQAWAIGAMMNARGLMELIILNIGLERGVITPTMFAVGVIMAIVTTLMATPLFDLILRGRRGGVANRGDPREGGVMVVVPSGPASATTGAAADSETGRLKHAQ